MLRSLLVLIFTIIFSLNSFGVPKRDLINSFNKDFDEILVDVRGSRGGNGDVAAGYLMVMEFFRNYSLHKQITVLVDQKSEQILKRLARDNAEFWQFVNVETMSSLPREKQFDLYIALASPSGSFRNGGQFKEKSDAESNLSTMISGIKKKIKISPDGVMIVQTVLGNTENLNSTHSNAVVRQNGINYEMSPAGIAEYEAGIYNDYVALELKQKSPDEIKIYLKSELSSMGDTYSAVSIFDILNNTKLKNSKFGLAYGITADDTKAQFLTYLKGLPEHTRSGYVIVTPSGFWNEDIPEKLKSRVRIFANGEALPDIAEPGKIYIVRVKTLPHRVFVGLMAHSMKSGLVPVGAGDGFMSAAINLGGAFVLTKVDWNESNIKNLQLRLGEAAKNLYPHKSQYDYATDLFYEIYGKSDFTRAQELQTVGDLFNTLDTKINSLAERIINAATAIKKMPSREHKNFDTYVERISDPTLQASVRVGGIQAQLVVADEFVKYITQLGKNSIEKLKMLRSIGMLDIATKIQATLTFKQKVMNVFSLNFSETSLADKGSRTLSISDKVKYMRSAVMKEAKRKISADYLMNLLTEAFNFVSRKPAPAKAERSLETNICSKLF